MAYAVSMVDLVVYLGIFLAVLGESTLLVGAFVPGLNTIIITSFLAHSGDLRVELVYISAWLGMVIGDSLGYVLGRFGLDRIAKARAIFEKARPKVESFTYRHPRLIVFYQFVGFARAPLPVLLGAVHHPVKDWITLVVSSTTVFITTVVGISYVLGGLVERDTAITIAIVSQIVLAFGFVLFVMKDMGFTTDAPNKKQR